MQTLSLPCSGPGSCVSLEALSRRVSPLQRLDARVKLLLLPAFTMAVVTTPIRFWPGFAGYAAILAAAVYTGGLPWRPLGRRLATVVPFILAGAAFLPFHQEPGGIPGEPLTGILLFLNFSLKSLLGTSATLVLTASTPFPRLLAGLEALFVPRVAVMIFSFTYRYLFVLGEEAQRMKRACDSRCYRGHWITDARAIGRLAGTLFLRSYERGERVYLAMLARGFDGAHLPHRERSPLAEADLRVLCGAGLLLAALWAAARLG